MKTVAEFAATTVHDHFDAAPPRADATDHAGLAALAATLAGTLRDGADPASPACQTASVALLCGMLAAFGEDGASPAAYAVLAAFTPAAASAAYDLLLLSQFPDGAGDTAELDDATVLLLAALLARADRPEDAVALLAGETATRRVPDFLRAAWWARGHALGRDGSLVALWTPFSDRWPSVTAAREAIDAKPLALDAHRALARRLAEAGRLEGAFAALATGLALPVGQGDKIGLGDDLAVLALFAASQGQAALLGSQRVRFALAAVPAVARHAAALLAAEPWLRDIADAEALAAVEAMLAEFAAELPARISAFPLGPDGKPHVNMLFLEITNYCNQKCTFCPDMHRENARSWLPLAEVKRLIDEVADTMTLNMLQLNAYGEPLLHPDIDQILAHIRAKRMPWPTFFTTHGMTLVDKKLKQLSHNYPTGIAVSLHNDSQESYEVSRNNKIGDYATMVARVTALMRQMAHEGAACHLRLYQMVCNGHEDLQVPPEVRGAFAHDVERFARHVRQWERTAAEIAATAPREVRARALFNTVGEIERAFRDAVDDCGVPLPILEWFDAEGHLQQAFMSARPVETYANLLLEYHPDWTVERRLINQLTCRFLEDPSLTVFATGRLGLCCLDMNNTATFGSIGDFPSLAEAVTSPAARAMIAELSNGIATSAGCQICLGTGVKQCG